MWKEQQLFLNKLKMAIKAYPHQQGILLFLEQRGYKISHGCEILTSPNGQKFPGDVLWAIHDPVEPHINLFVRAYKNEKDFKAPPLKCDIEAQIKYLWID